MTRMKDRLHATRAALRDAVRTQLSLQQRYVDRHALSGRETAAAARVLRWRGDELVGCELPRH
jgi:hypothetical protein